MSDFPRKLLGKPAAIYAHCMDEVKFRFEHTARIVKSFDDLEGHGNRWLALEAVALQYRKIIELVAFASIAANEEQYARLRSDFSKDWNARRIFKSLAIVNPNFYPKPISGLIAPANPGEHETIDEYDDGFLSLDDAIDVYERCGAVLHAENRLGAFQDPNDSFAYFASRIELFRKLLSDFWVHLESDEHRYIVQLHLGSEKRVEVFAAIIG